MQCLDESKAPMLSARKKECNDWIEDYQECLHHGKEVGVPGGAWAAGMGRASGIGAWRGEG
jgi:hypothetical protein